MKPRSIISCFFAAYGVYLTFIAIFSVAGAVSAIMSFRGISETYTWNTFVRSSWQFLPLVVGSLFMLFSKQLAALAIRFAGMENEPDWEMKLSSRDLLAVLLACVGAYLVVTECAQVCRVLYLSFVTYAGDRFISENAAQHLPDRSQIVAHFTCAILGAFLAKKCQRVASILFSTDA
jgi:hypothetical protein